MKFVKKLWKSEKGSITIFVLTTLLLFITGLSVTYVNVSNKNAAQIASVQKIQEEYDAKSNDEVIEEEYNSTVDRLDLKVNMLFYKMSGETYSTSEWINENIYMELVYNTEVKEEDKYFYKDDKKVSYTGKYEITDNCTIKVVNGDSTITKVINRIDKENPTIELDRDGGTYLIPVGDQLRDISTKVIASDNASGVKNIQYAWSTSKTVKPEDSSYQIIENEGLATKQNCTEGNYYLWIKVTDNAGNQEEKVSSAFKVSERAPFEIIADTDTWTNQDVEATIKYEDGITGEITVTVTGEEGTDYEINDTKDKVTVKTNNQTITVTITESNGEKYTEELVIKNIDKTLPNVIFSPNGGNYVMPAKGNATIKTTITAKDEGGSGLNTLEYAWSTSNTEEPTNWTAFANGSEISKTDCAEGTYYLWTKVTDNAGNRAEEGKVSEGFIVASNTEKDNTITLTPNTDKWTNKDVVINIEYGKNITDNRKAGIGSANIANATTVTTTENGIVYAEGTDKAGNKVTAQLEIKNIDKVLPTVTITPNNGKYTMPTSGNATIKTTLTAADEGGSGLNTLEYEWSTSNITEPTTWTTFTNGSEVSKTDCTAGTYYLWTNVVDNAGNRAETGKVSGAFIVGANTVKENEIKMEPDKTVWTNEDVKVTISIGENLTGDKTVDVTGTEGTDYVKNGITEVIIKTNNQTITVTAKDEAGNEIIKTVTITNIDKINPTIDSLTASTTEATNGTVIITGKATDEPSGIIAYQFSKDSNLTKDSEGWTTIDPTTEQITKDFQVDENGTYYFYVKDQAGNVSKKEITINNIDIISPTISVLPNSSEVVKNKEITITVTDEGGANLSDSNQYQYQLGTNNTTAPTGTWSTYKNGETITLGDNKTGTYYLWVKEVSDKAGNSSIGGSKVGAYHVFGTYVFDNEAPTVTFTPNENKNYAKSQSTKVTVTENGTSGINASSLKYQWTQSTTIPEESTFSSTFTTGETISKDSVTGNNWYLWILAKDNLGNTNIVKSGEFYLDNIVPTQTAPGIKATTSTVIVSTKQTDADSGIDTTTRQYAIKKNSETTWGTWVSDTSESHSFTGLTLDTKYDVKTRVKDKAGNGYVESEIATITTTKITTPIITPSETNWTNKDIIITIEYPDIEGITKQYSYDGTDWKEYIEELTISENKTIYARTIDSDGQGADQVATAKIENIDKTLPTVTLSPNGGKYTMPSSGNATIKTTLTAADEGGSGLDTLKYAWSTSNTTAPTTWTTFTNGSEVSKTDCTAGTYYLWTNVTDKAGNTATNVRTTSAFKVTANTDAANKITLTQSPTGWTNSDVTVTVAYGSNLTANKTLTCSGTENTDYTVNGTTSVVVKTNNKTVTATATDAAGNKITATLQVTTIDKTLPTVTLGTNGGTITIPTGSTTANISTKITASDEGGSGLSTMQYQISTSTTIPGDSDSNWTDFTNAGTISIAKSGGNYYLYTKVTDAAGNRATSIQKSNAFIVNYEVKYDANGGTGAPAATTKTQGTNLTLSSTKPTRTGYTFSGWATSSTATTATYQAGGTYSNNAAVTLYAVWTANTYTIEYNGNGNTGGSTASSTHTYDVEKALTSNGFSKTGYTFKGWATTSTGSVAYEDVAKVKNLSETNGTKVTLYAVWEIKQYTVTYNYSTNGGTSATKTTATVNYNATVDLTPTATKSGYTFVGWNTNKDATSKLSSYTMPANDITLYAIYSKAITGTFNYYSGTGVSAKTVEGIAYNTATSVTITTPTIANVTKDGTTYTARGWSTTNTADATVNVNSGASVTLSANTTYYASYQGTITITYNNNTTETTSTVPSNQTGTVYMNYAGTMKGTSITLASAMTRTGYTFDGWNTNSSGTGTSYLADSTATLTLNTTLYAKWTANIYDITLDQQFYTVNFVALEQADQITSTSTIVVKSEKVPIGKSATAPSIIDHQQLYSSEGYPGPIYNFDSWNTTFDNVQSDLIVKAKYSVFGPTGGGYGVQTCEDPSAITNYTNTDTVYEKYDSGIYKEQTCTTQITTSENPVTIPTIPNYTFEGYYTGKDGTGTQMINKNGYLTSNFTNNYYSSNTTLYAYWTPKYYEVTLDQQFYTVTFVAVPQTNTVNDGATGVIVKQEKVAVGGAATAPSVKSWHTLTSEATIDFNKWDKTYSNVQSNLVVKAQYTLYGPTGGTGSYDNYPNPRVTNYSNTETIHEKYGVGIYLNGKEVTTSSNPVTIPTTDNYTFEGYYTGKDGTGTQMIDKNGYLTSNFTSTFYSANATLYAYWKATN